MEALAGYDDWKCTPPEAVRGTVRCCDCGETCDLDDAERSGWDVVDSDMDEEAVCRGMCPVCLEEANDE